MEPSEDIPQNGWSLNTLYLHIMALLAEREKRMADRLEGHHAALVASIDAAKIALRSNDERYRTQFEAQKEAVASALAAADRAVMKAETAAEKRFESVNEFRNTLSDQQRNLMPRAEVDILIASLRKDVAALSDQVDTLRSTRAGFKDAWAYVVGAIGVLLTISWLIKNVGAQINP